MILDRFQELEIRMIRILMTAESTGQFRKGKLLDQAWDTLAEMANAHMEQTGPQVNIVNLANAMEKN